MAAPQPPGSGRLSWRDVPGWFDYEALYDDVARWAPWDALLVEVGVWLGRSALYLDERLSFRCLPQRPRLVLVDHCVGSPGGPDYGLHLPVLRHNGGTSAGPLHRNLLAGAAARADVSLLVAPSARAARLFEAGTVDFVFIDAGHTREAVAADIAAWLPKVRPGGRIAGHDYAPEWPGVVQAVDECLGGKAALFPGTRSCWHLQL